LHDPRCLDLFVPLLYSDSVQERLQAGGALAGLGQRAWEPLLTALADSRPETRMAAIPGLIGSGQRALEPLLDVFERDPSPAARGHAAAALGAIGGKGLVEVLLPALDREEPEALPGIIAGLRDLGDPRALPALRRLIDRMPNVPDRLHGQIRQTARRAIEHLAE
jgi:HEAT repeat protein